MYVAMGAQIPNDGKTASPQGRTTMWRDSTGKASTVERFIPLTEKIISHGEKARPDQFMASAFGMVSVKTNLRGSVPYGSIDDNKTIAHPLLRSYEMRPTSGRNPYIYFCEAFGPCLGRALVHCEFEVSALDII